MELLFPAPAPLLAFEAEANEASEDTFQGNEDGNSNR